MLSNRSFSKLQKIWTRRTGQGTISIGLKYVHTIEINFIDKFLISKNLQSVSQFLFMIDNRTVV